MNSPFDSGARSPAENPKTGTDGLRQTYIPPAISYNETMEVTANTCLGGKPNPTDCPYAPSQS